MGNVRAQRQRADVERSAAHARGTIRSARVPHGGVGKLVCEWLGFEIAEKEPKRSLSPRSQRKALTKLMLTSYKRLQKHRKKLLRNANDQSQRSDAEALYLLTLHS